MQKYDQGKKAKILVVDDEQSLREICQDALGEMGNIKSVPMLLKRIEDSPAVLRNKIVKTVIKILGGKALTFLSNKEKEKLHEYLLAAVNDEEADIQDAAILGLGYVGGSIRATRKILDCAALMDPEHEEGRLNMAHKFLCPLETTGSTFWKTD